MIYAILKISVLLPTVVILTHASAGDRSWTFVKCLNECKEANCTTQEQLSNFIQRQPMLLQHLGWDCTAECQHTCMWKAVDDFRKDGIPQQQYYGKWPFIRVFGVQEPASSLFSVLNGLSHIAMLHSFRKNVPSSAPMFYVWHLYSLANVNAWCWSTVFHIRDTRFSEMMDYFSAILMVLFQLLACSIRLSLPRYHWWIGGATGATLLAYYVYHVHYLAFVHFDYGYNMRANVAVGLTNVAVWLIWFFCVRRRQPYVKRGALAIILLTLLLMLELLDFPPWFWTIDAHSLWHLGTIPLPLLWYRFLMDDCLYLLKTSSSSVSDSSSNVQSTSDVSKKHV